jgi:hypothetical protein
VYRSAGLGKLEGVVEQLLNYLGQVFRRNCDRTIGEFERQISKALVGLGLSPAQGLDEIGAM